MRTKREDTADKMPWHPGHAPRLVWPEQYVRLRGLISSHHFHPAQRLPLLSFLNPTRLCALRFYIAG